MSQTRTHRPLDEALDEGLERLERAGLRRVGRPVRREGGAIVQMDGRRLVDFSSNDYLGLAADPRLGEAVFRAFASQGAGAGASRLISGTDPLHERLEGELASFAGTEAALLFASGYMANVGAIPALAGPGDILYSDELNHASLIDGCRLSRAQVRVFPHRDVDALAEMLEEDRGREGERWVVVEGVFSMEGDLFPLDRLVELARTHGARIYLDEAHAIGVLGEGGRGAREAWGMEGEVDVVMGTLGKAFGVAGAFVGGSSRLREWLLNRSRSFVFSTAPPPALAAAALEAVRIVRGEPERRARLRRNASHLREKLEKLKGMGHLAPEGAPGHIVSVPAGDEADAVRLARGLEEAGFLVGCIRPPSVPAGTSRLRIGVSAAHTEEHLNGLLDAISKLRPDRGP